MAELCRARLAGKLLHLQRCHSFMCPQLQRFAASSGLTQACRFQHGKGSSHVAAASVASWSKEKLLALGLGTAFITFGAVAAAETPQKATEDEDGHQPDEGSHQLDSVNESQANKAARRQLAVENNRGCSLAATPISKESVRRDKSKLPIIPLSDVRADRGESVWVTFRGGVYDVTSFLEAHPGGQHRIRMVNGMDLSAFWNVYTLHDRPHIRAFLEDYRIGNLTPEDAITIEKETQFSSMYDEEPERPKRRELRIPSEKPWNSEPADLSVLVDSYFTPNDMFFVRNHNAVPAVDPKEYRLEILPNEKCGLKGASFTLDELKTKFPKHTVVSALQCAGNRQEDFVTKDRPLYVAPHWRNGAIGNAKWAGVKVRDVLRACGMKVDRIALGECGTGGQKVVNFVGLDTDETGIPYAGVVPIEKVIDPWGDALLVYEMNDETLPPDHGFPIRLLAPGHAGCRNVKWVESIFVSEEASELDSGSKLDRHFAPDVGFKKHVIWGSEPLQDGPVIQTLPVQSIICSPAHLSTLPGDSEAVELRGVAWSGGGRGVCRVEVSIDGGKTFTSAKLQNRPHEMQSKVQSDAPCPMPQAGMGRLWAWQQFTAEIKLPTSIKEQLAGGDKVELELVSVQLMVILILNLKRCSKPGTSLVFV
eukprot:m.275784 g.275784  ORF g.275784 m.275784 type:complete len:649 (+) comp16295_c0_seq2:1254-3200(+)